MLVVRLFFEDCKFKLKRLYSGNRGTFVWFAVSFAAGMLLGLIFRTSLVDNLFIEQSLTWITVIVIRPAFFTTLWRLFAFFFVFFVVFFVACSFDWLYPLAFFVVVIRGYVFICSVIMLIELLAFAAIVFFIFLILVQQFLFIMFASFTCAHCRCEFLRCGRRRDFLRGRGVKFFLTGFAVSLLAALLICLMLYLVVNPLLSFV